MSTTTPTIKIPATLASAFYPSPVSIVVSKIQVSPLVFDITASVGGTTIVRRHSFMVGAAIDSASLVTTLTSSAQLAADAAAWAQTAAEVNVGDVADVTG